MEDRKFARLTSVGLPLAALALAMSACDDGRPIAPDPDMPLMAEVCTASPAVQVYVSNNGTANAGTVDVFSEALVASGVSYAPGNNEGIAFDASDNLVQNGDGAQTSIRVFAAVGTRDAGNAFDTAIDREIIGANTSLMAPKGIDIANGYVIVADFGAGDIKVFTTADGGNAAPTATVTTGGAAAWDIDYVEDDDRLFAALTDGTIAVYDNFLGTSGSMIGAGGVSRTITPSDDTGAQTSTNIHGIAYSSLNDQLVVTDVGDASVATDGSIYVITGASTATGNVEPASIIEGPSTLLGNPVDVVLNGPDALIAEKSNDQLLAFCNIFAGNNGDLPPSIATPQTKPEAIALRSTSGPSFTDVSDDESGSFAAVLASSNGGTLSADAVVRIASDLSANLGTVGGFSGIGSIESLTIDQNGDGLLTFDATTASTGGLMAIAQVASGRASTTAGAGARIISGPSTGLMAPKGLDIASALGLVFVADFGAGNIKAFSTAAGGNVAPRFTIDDVGAGSVWDVDYDPSNDRLFASGTSGTVLVYDNVSTSFGASGPDRVIVPANVAMTQVSVNLHGIDYLASADALLLSDVGSAASASDGQLFVIPAASAADGNTTVSVQIGGAATALGNPVDVASNGTNLYVAEKSNATVLRYNGILGLAGVLNQAADASFTVPAAESVVLVPGGFVF